MLNEKLKFFREKKGLSQKDFADKLFLSQNTISQYENGKRSINNTLLEQMAKALDIKIVLFEKQHAHCSFQSLEEKILFLEEFSNAYEAVMTNIAPDFEYGEERELKLLKELLVNATVKNDMSTFILFPIDVDTENMDCIINCLTQNNVLSEEKVEFLWEGLELVEKQRKELDLNAKSIEEVIQYTEEEKSLGADIYYNVNGVKTDSDIFVQIFHNEKKILVNCTIGTKHHIYGEVIVNIKKFINERYDVYKDYQIIVS